MKKLWQNCHFNKTNFTFSIAMTPKEWKSVKYMGIIKTMDGFVSEEVFGKTKEEVIEKLKDTHYV